MTPKWKTGLRVLSIACAFFLVVFTSACGSDGEDSERGLTGDRAVSITIECESNLVFSRYDLDVYIDGVLQGSLDHGTSKTFEMNLADGDHALRITKKGDDGVDGNVEFSIDGDITLKYKAKCTNSQVEIEEIDVLNPPISSSEASSQYHDEAYRAFEEAGFTNIREEELRDLTPDQQNRNWYTDIITVGGRDDFSEEDSFLADDEVVITYHVLADLNVPASSSELEGRNYEDVVSMFEDAGFINVTTRTTGASGAASTVSDVCIGGIFGTTDFSAEDKFAFDSGVEITYYEGEADFGSDSGGEGPSDADDSSDWDLEWEARKTFESYGEILYPYGFKCHWILDLVTCESQGDGTFFIKVGVTITNEYGAERRTYAQGIAGNGTVVDFYVS